MVRWMLQILNVWMNTTVKGTVKTSKISKRWYDSEGNAIGGLHIRASSVELVACPAYYRRRGPRDSDVPGDGI